MSSLLDPVEPPPQQAAVPQPQVKRAPALANVTRPAAAGSKVARPGAIRPATPARTPRSTGAASNRPLRKRDMVIITTQLAIMARSGLDLAEALKNLVRQTRRPDAHAALAKLYSAVENGEPFAGAVSAQRRVFGETFSAVVAAGEASGTLTDSLERVNQLLRNELRLRNTLRSVISYPVVLIGVTVMVLVAMAFFVLPQFASVYASMDAAAPPVTQLLLDAGTFFRGYWLLIVPTIAAGFWGLWQLRHAPAWKAARDRWMVRSKILGPTCRALFTGRSFRVIGTMLDSGVPLLESLSLVRETTGNRVFTELFAKLEQEIVAGRGLSPTLLACDCLPEGTAEMVAAAEKSGSLASVMLLVGEFNENEGEQLLRDLVKVLEPVIIVALGAVVAGVVLSVMLPLLDLSTGRGM